MITYGMPKLGFDLDGVVVDSFDLVLKEWNSRHGTTWTEEDVTSYDLSCIGITDPIRLYKTLEWIYPCAKPVKKSIQALTHLHDIGFKINFITARGYIGADDVAKKWLKDHKVKYDNLITNSGYDKSIYVKKLDLDMYIDDSFDQIMRVARGTSMVDCLIYDRAYNRNQRCNRVHRVHNWDQVVGFVKDRYLK